MNSHLTDNNVALAWSCHNG